MKLNAFAVRHLTSESKILDYILKSKLKSRIQMAQLASYIVITHNRSPGLIDRVAAISRSAPGAEIVVVDNSIGPDLTINKTALKNYSSVRHFGSRINNRFVALNIGIANSTSEYLAFRTDDDEFDEDTALEVYSEFRGCPVIVSDYLYSGSLRTSETWERPLSSLVVRRDLAQSLGGLGVVDSSDWDFVRRIFDSAPVKYDSRLWFNKLEHSSGSHDRLSYRLSFSECAALGVRTF